MLVTFSPSQIFGVFSGILQKIVFFSGKKSENFRNGIEKQRFRGQRFRGVGVYDFDPLSPAFN